MLQGLQTLKRSETLADTLVRALSGQKELYVQLLALAQKQSQHVATGENEELMEVLAERSRLIDRVAPLDRELQPYKGRWQQVLDGLDPANRQKVAGLLREVQQLLADILAQDERDKESLQRQKTDMGVQIKTTVTGAALSRAYGVRR
jgi:predicted nuclease with TOPRIM domain